jgi:SOS-response transcriptional repressor LexA
MPGNVVSIGGAREGTYVVLETALPGIPARPAGVILADPESGRGWVRMLRDFGEVPEEDAEVLEAVEAHLRGIISESGVEAVLAGLEDSLSNALRVSERRKVSVDAFTRVLDRLYREHVDDVPVEPFRTHLPLYSLRAAAGALGEEMPSQAEDWVPAPEGMRLEPNLFIARVVGRSMEPRIPDGSLNLFRLNPVGSRQGKIVLVERFGAFDETARYTVKRYTSTKRQSGDEQWEHARIRLEPLNPEFEPWDVGPEDFAVVAEWLRVVE